MKVSFKLSEKDRQQYGGDEWFHINTDELADLGYDRLSALEKEIRREDDTSIPRILAIEWPNTTMLGVRALAWLALRTSGQEKPDWKDFKPDIMATFFKIDAGDDADPPAGGSSEPPSGKTATARNTRSKKE